MLSRFICSLVIVMQTMLLAQRHLVNGVGITLVGVACCVVVWTTVGYVRKSRAGT